LACLPAPSPPPSSASGLLISTQLQRRKLNLKVKFEGGSSYHGFKRVVPGGFNMGFIGSTCTALTQLSAASYVTRYGTVL
jgi:hypothetical protein